MADTVPHVESLDEVYRSSESSSSVASEHTARFKNLLKSFENEYGRQPDFVARSPGRVNIIGEHIDYSLYNVLPTAVTVDVLIAVTSSDAGKDSTTVKVANVNHQKYASKTITIPRTGKIEFDAATHEWSNYFQAGMSGPLELLKEKHGPDFVPKNMQVVVDGNVPAGGGLSSSAAFVCASALAILEVNGHKVSKQELLDLCLASERSVGVYSGGMDQAASIFSERGYLLYCQFFPKFAAEHVPVPKSDPEITFLIAQSFVTSDKAKTAPKHYNLRVVEVTFATVVLAKLLDITLNPDQSSLGFSLRNLQEEVVKADGRRNDSLDKQVDTMRNLVKSKLDKDAYTREDVATVLGISVDTLTEKYLSKFPVHAEAFKLRQRATHVLEEARRVLAFKDTLTNNKSLDHENTLYLGSLMNETQDSCRDIYECSCPEVDEICSIARAAGAYGSRLTGAGWGGCTVHLVPQDKVDSVTQALKKEYYFKRFPDITEEKLKEAIVISKPSQGSSIISGEALEE